MIELMHSPSELIRQSVCKCIPQISRFFEDKSKKFLDENLQQILKNNDERKLRGSAYIVSGLMKGLGMNYINECDLLPKV